MSDDKTTCSGARRRPEGSRLTPGQSRVYRTLLEAGAPMSAYQLLDALNRSEGRHVYPQTVYRALAMLRQRGLVHRLETANAYLACSGPARPHESIHLLCDGCGSAVELVDPRIGELLERDAGLRQFRVRRQTVELHGLCAVCACSDGS